MRAACLPRLSSPRYELLTNACGDLYLSSLGDLGISKDATLFLVKGKWYTGSRAKECLADGAINFSLTAEFMVTPLDANRKTNDHLAQLPARPLPLNDYIVEIVKSGHAKPKMMSHKIERNEGTASYTVTSEKEFCLHQTQAYEQKPRSRVTVDNFSLQLSVPALLKSDRVTIRPHVSFNCESHIIEFGYPGVHLKDDTALPKGEMVCLALNENRHWSYKSKSQEVEGGGSPAGEVQDAADPAEAVAVRKKRQRQRSTPMVIKTPKRRRRSAGAASSGSRRGEPADDM